MKRKIIPLSIIILGMMVAAGILFVEGSSTSVAAKGFGFEKNIEHRKSADTESVLGCMASCQEMFAGWSEMDLGSKNYARQQEKIAAKMRQCSAMNKMAGSPVNEEEIFLSCSSECHIITPEILIDDGVCSDISLIDKIGIPQCCTTEIQRRTDCGVDQEWVIGVAAFPVCYIPGS